MANRPKTPLLAADIIIELVDKADDAGRVPIVLIERKNPPHGWALPGGFVDLGETVEQGAIREAKEETGLEVTLKGLLGCYSHPARDPRRQVVSLVYVAQARGEPIALDDAKKVMIASVESFAGPLAFDHEKILSDYLKLNPEGLLRHIHAG